MDIWGCQENPNLKEALALGAESVEDLKVTGIERNLGGREVRNSRKDRAAGVGGRGGPDPEHILLAQEGATKRGTED